MSSINRSQNSKRDRDNSKVFVIIAASGLGQRFNSDLPKQFCLIDGIPVIYRSVGLFLSMDFVSGVVCVIPDGFQDKYNEIFQYVEDQRLILPVVGGRNRSDSVRIGLESIENYSPDYVLIHDAARCFCPKNVVWNVFEKLKSGAIAVVPTIPSNDSVRFNGKNVDRSRITLSQTPQGFQFKRILNLHKKYENQKFSDDVSLCDMENIKVETVDGDACNKKITFQSDIEEYVFKTGFGYDAHKFSSDSNRKLYLMGKEIPDHTGLEGVSDADVGIHSLVDAILGSLCEGSIGEHFPENDPKNQNADSKTFLEYCRNLLLSKNAIITSIDTTIICESPNISKHSNDMKDIIAKCLKIDKSIINIKGKTTEGMGFEGRKEGISASSIISIKQKTSLILKN